MPGDLDAAVAPDGWRLELVRETGSTNADAAAAADAGAAEGLVVLAERQSAGRGRLDRSWSAPEGTGLTFSVLLRPDVPVARVGWLPLIAGLAVAEAVQESTGVAARVKWPNDVLVGDRKLAGVLSELRPGTGGAESAVVVGVGLNVALGADDLPVPGATSLLLEGASTTDRAAVLDSILSVFQARYRSWVEAAGDPDASGVRPAYVVRCATVGRRVAVDLAGGALEGEALGVDVDGRLRVAAEDGQVHEVAAGDVVHVR